MKNSINNKIFPIGDRIIVKRIKSDTNINQFGVIKAHTGEKTNNVWGEVVALPSISENIFIKGVKIGDKLLYKEFKTDEFVSADGNEEYVVLEMQPNNGSRQGQIQAIEIK